MKERFLEVIIISSSSVTILFLGQEEDKVGKNVLKSLKGFYLRATPLCLENLSTL